MKQKLELRDFVGIGTLVLSLIFEFHFFRIHFEALYSDLTRDFGYLIGVATNSIEGFVLVVHFHLQFFILIFTLLALILVLARKKRASRFLLISSISIWAFSVLLLLLNYSLMGLTNQISVISLMNHIFTGDVYSSYLFTMGYHSLKAFPLIPLMIASAILIDGSRIKKSQVIQSEDFDSIVPQPIIPPPPPMPPVAPINTAPPVPFGMKKCPDCAELIQGEAVKCRFCNYRFK